MMMQQKGIVSHSIKEYEYPEMLDSSNLQGNTDIRAIPQVVKRCNITSIVSRICCITERPRRKSMNEVFAIKNERVIVQIRNALRGAGKWRDYALFRCGMNFGLRVSDLLRLEISDVRSLDGSIKSSFQIRERKTGKMRTITINDGAREGLETYFGKVDLSDNDPLFKNPSTGNSLSRSQVWRLINEWCWNAGLRNVPVGTHTFRKTFGYHAHKRGVPLELLMKRFNHRSQSTTLRYIGVTADDIKNMENEIIL